MGFFDNNNNNGVKAKSTTYVELSETPTTLRPVRAAPTPVWVHKIHKVVYKSVTGADLVVRGYSTFACTSTGRGGVGCPICATKDPLWHMLGQREQYNSKKLVVHFPKAQIALLPVKNVQTGEIRVLKGGQQVFEEMNKWWDLQQPHQQDLTRCDWSFWKTGKAERTKYQSSRLDPTPVTFTAEELAQADAVLKAALADLTPPPHDQFVALVSGNVDVLETMRTERGTDFAVTQQATVVTGTQPQVVVQTNTLQSSQPEVATRQATPVNQAATSTAQNEHGQFRAEDLAAWINKQPEFSGSVGMVKNLIPALKELNGGSINYQSLSSDALLNLKAGLERFLNNLRAK
jgi:hypothetical protein